MSLGICRNRSIDLVLTSFILCPVHDCRASFLKDFNLTSPFTITQATGNDIIPIVHKIHSAIDGEGFANATMALLYTVFTIAYPEISNDDLARGIKDSSQHICLLLDSFENPVEDGPDAKLKFN